MCEPVWGPVAHAEPDLGTMDSVYVDDVKEKVHVGVTGGFWTCVPTMAEGDSVALWTESGYVLANEESLGGIPDASPMEGVVTVRGDETLVTAGGVGHAVVALCGAAALATGT